MIQNNGGIFEKVRSAKTKQLKFERGDVLEIFECGCKKGNF